MNTVLVELHYGRDAVGIDTAAQAYFGVPADALRDEEALALIALAQSASWYGFDCGKSRERFDRRFAQLAERLGSEASDWTADGALARLRPMGCAQRANRAAQASRGTASESSR